MEKAPATLDALLTAIAKKYLNINTLEKLNSDDQDFHTCAVWNTKSALEAAFKVGIAMTLEKKD